MIFHNPNQQPTRERPSELLLGAIAIFTIIASVAPARPVSAGATTPNLQAAQPDIREIFLTVPLPNLDEDIFLRRLGDPAERKALLEKTDFNTDKNALDIPNGYLRIETEFQADEYRAAIRIVVTYFTKQNGDRLVVVQTNDLFTHPDPIITDGFYLLANGKYTQQRASQYLPRISFFGDFWGNQPLPDKDVRLYVKVQGDARFYTIEWPRKGTVALAQSFVPYCDDDTKEQRRIDRMVGRRQIKYLELIWDKDKGVFVKGAKTRNRQ